MRWSKCSWHGMGMLTAYIQKGIWSESDVIFAIFCHLMWNDVITKSLTQIYSKFLVIGFSQLFSSGMNRPLLPWLVHGPDRSGFVKAIDRSLISNREPLTSLIQIIMNLKGPGNWKLNEDKWWTDIKGCTGLVPYDTEYGMYNTCCISILECYWRCIYTSGKGNFRNVKFWVILWHFFPSKLHLRYFKTVPPDLPYSVKKSNNGKMNMPQYRAEDHIGIHLMAFSLSRSL